MAARSNSAVLEIPTVWLNVAMVSQALVSCFGLGGPMVKLHMISYRRAARLVTKALMAL